MIKRNPILLFMLIVFLTGIVFADEVTITTYYPSPYGSYRDLEVRKSLAVGNIGISGIGTVEALSQGELWVEDSVIFRGRDTDPLIPREGEVIYNSAENTLKYSSDGSTWRSFKSQCYVSYAGSCLSGYSNMGSAGNWGYCQSPFGEYIFSPPGAVFPPIPPGFSPCPPSYTTDAIGTLAYPSGTAIICCQ